ncbi:uncharacterized protein LOC105386454 [Plutella xylostella]|uniref:uncharacterized protein LOC105386454 n=1 Tax=Plutella xylostella TaxID=51655 RepID=UPI0020328961|nr:uncharacterized protein LOC105386454 [Plutella xylostella]
MPPKAPEGKRSILIVPSVASNKASATAPLPLEGGEETEIAATVSMPEDTGWGWLVVACAFVSIGILDGIAFTFGAMISDITQDMKSSESPIALVNSVAVGIYLMCGPVVSAFINRFGFRACCMTGSVISSVSLFISYFAPNYGTLLLFYGICAGFGYSLINMACGLVVGFHFERLRALALAIAASGSPVGVMSMFPLNSYLVNLGGWRPTTLLHAGMVGIIFFLGMSFRPLLTLTVTLTTDDEPTRTTAYLPSLANIGTQQKSKVDATQMAPSKAEKMFNAVSNTNFPTAASVVSAGQAAGAAAPAQVGTSTQGVSKLTISANQPQGGLSRRQIKQVQSIASRTNQQDSKQVIEVAVSEAAPPKKRSFWERLCPWQAHVPESRPMYRDDAFYDGDVKRLPEYQKSMVDPSGETKTGLEYQLAVSRAAAAADLQDRRGVLTTAARRVLATMLDPLLLKRTSFQLQCASGFLTYLGFLVPYVFIQERNKSAGISSSHCAVFVSVIGLSNATGRLILGIIASKVDPLKVYSSTLFVAGVATILSSISYNVYFQYGYCAIYGLCCAGVTCLRAVVIVSLYGLDKLTNATGMVLLFQGFGSMISTPLAGAIKKTAGYSTAFTLAGVFITSASVLLVGVTYFAKREKDRENQGVRTTKIK